MSVYAINLTELNDQKLKRAVSTVSENSVILFEDIDCMKLGGRTPRGETKSWNPEEAGDVRNDAAERHGVTLSGLLNVLDGFHAPENVLFLLTTNHMEALDPALLRPGRIDYRMYMGTATEEQKVELYADSFQARRC